VTGSLEARRTLGAAATAAGEGEVQQPVPAEQRSGRVVLRGVPPFDACALDGRASPPRADAARAPEAPALAKEPGVLADLPGGVGDPGSQQALGVGISRFSWRVCCQRACPCSPCVCCWSRGPDSCGVGRARVHGLGRGHGRGHRNSTPLRKISRIKKACLTSHDLWTGLKKPAFIPNLDGSLRIRFEGPM
jgi:hypothetical protein